MRRRASRGLAFMLAAATLPGMAVTGARDAELLPAIREGDYATVQALLETRAADPDHALPDGSTPLSWAVETQDPRMVRLLLGARARPDAARNAATAPLIVACEHGNAEIVDLLLDAGADPSRARDDGATSLEACAASVPAAIVERLIAGGAEVDHADRDGRTALMWAAATGRVDNIRLLVARGADVNRATAGGFTPLFFALKSGHPEAPVAILDAGGDADHVGPEHTTAVQLAMYQGDYAFAARMIERGADVRALDRDGYTLLHAAVIAGRPELVKLLLAQGADPDAPTGKPSVEWRYEANFKSGVVEHPAKSPLFLAAEHGSVDSMRLLAAAGADPGFRLDDGKTIVHAAISGGEAALACALQLLPDANVRDRKGRTPLHLLLGGSAGPETAALMRLLAARGARTDLADRDGLTAAGMAARTDTPAAMKAAYDAAFRSQLALKTSR
ncbi:MAG: ankyrin repeat domain-containing protein [Solimonas sp.]